MSEKLETIVYAWIHKGGNGRYVARKAPNQNDPLKGIGAGVMLELPESQWKDIDNHNRQDIAWQTHLWSLATLSE